MCKVRYCHFIAAGVSIAVVPIDEYRVAFGAAFVNDDCGDQFNRKLARTISEGRARRQRDSSRLWCKATVEDIKELIEYCRKHEQIGWCAGPIRTEINQFISKRRYGRSVAV